MTDIARRFICGAAAVIAGLMLLADAKPAAADAPEWTVDPAKSSIGFTGRQMGVPSKGRFKSFTAKVTFDPGDLSGSAVEVTVDAASADAGNPDIDKELKQPKWFDVARFPTVRFVTTAFRAKGPEAGGRGEYEAAAKLTIRDVTADVVLPFKLEIGQDPADPGRLVARMTGALTISRTRFGVGRDEWRDTKIVGDEVDLNIDVLARRKK
jgi:polyisoprenoid-binding protein YceI